MENYGFNCDEGGSCDCSIYGKNKKKKIPYGKMAMYGLALGIVLYAAWDQYSQNKEKEEVKLEQVGKSIDNFFGQ